MELRKYVNSNDFVLFAYWGGFRAVASSVLFLALLRGDPWPCSGDHLWCWDRRAVGHLLGQPCSVDYLALKLMILESMSWFALYPSSAVTLYVCYFFNVRS